MTGSTRPKESGLNITCPQCGFTRELPPERIPDKPVMATCPKCACRFRFYPCTDKEKPVFCQHQDDPLPPGAIVPGKDPVQDAPETDAAYLQSLQKDKDDISQTAHQAHSHKDIRLSSPDEEVTTLPEDRSVQAKDETPAEDDYDLPPWETAPGRDGWFAAFYQTVILVLFAATRFFASLDPRASLLRALYFFLLVCVIQIVVEDFWMSRLIDFLQTEAAVDPDLQSLTALFAERESLAMTILFQTGIQVLKLYAFSGLLYLSYRFIVPGRVTFPLLFQVMAYSTAPALLCVIPVLGTVTGLIWSLACMLVGCRAAMGLNWQQTLLGFLPLCLVGSVMVLQVFGSLGGL